MAKLWHNRILSDGLDQAAWLEARRPVIGASDAARFTNPASVEKYLAAKLDQSFTGNSYTARGHEFEQDILAYLGVTPNTALIHAPGNRGFAATPDGLDPDFGAECKVRHGRIDPMPSAAEWRQLAWQFMCVPEIQAIRFGTITLVSADGEWLPRLKDAFSGTEISRNDPKIVKATALIVPIATEVLSALEWAQKAEKEIDF